MTRSGMEPGAHIPTPCIASLIGERHLSDFNARHTLRIRTVEAFRKWNTVIGMIDDGFLVLEASIGAPRIGLLKLVNPFCGSFSLKRT